MKRIKASDAFSLAASVSLLVMLVSVAAVTLRMALDVWSR